MVAVGMYSRFVGGMIPPAAWRWCMHGPSRTAHDDAIAESDQNPHAGNSSG